jgi:HSP20 family protein
MSRLSRLFEPLFDWEQESSMLPEFRWPLPLLAGNEFPDLNVWDDERTAYVEAELPGLGADDVRIDVAGAELTISGERKLQETAGTPLRRERVTGPFRRTITLPWELAADKAEASLRDGVLTVRIPKSERAKVRKIQVKTTG